ncbi:MAG: DUF3784 domain-containing protein [Clostridium butyricum]|nr:DUF3784 domain-containing protein [Clostridium butyricum]
MECVISISALLSLTIIGILFYNGKCAFLISSYYMLDEKQKKEYDKRSLLRFMSYITFVIDVLTGICILGSYFDVEWLSIISAGTIVCVVIFSEIYWNIGKRFKVK